MDYFVPVAVSLSRMFEALTTHYKIFATDIINSWRLATATWCHELYALPMTSSWSKFLIEMMPSNNMYCNWQGLSAIAAQLQKLSRQTTWAYFIFYIKKKKVCCNGFRISLTPLAFHVRDIPQQQWWPLPLNMNEMILTQQRQLLHKALSTATTL